MKIAVVCERFEVSRGGAERSTYEFSCCLAESGAQVTLVAGKVVGRGSEGAGYEVAGLDVGAKGGRGFWCEFEEEVIKHVGAGSYDIVHSMAPVLIADVYQPRGGSHLHGARRHAVSYGSGIGAWGKRATGWLNRGRRIRIGRERQLCAAADGPIVAAVSRYVAGQFERDYGLDAARIRVIGNGVMVEEFVSEQSKRRGEKLRKLYNPEGDLTLFVFAAENMRLKGLGWLLRAARRAKELKTDGRGFRVLIAGGENYVKYWHDCQKLGLGEQVIFMGTTGMMPAVLRMCDAVVLPSYNDACSRVVLEGLAAGRPAITTRYNGAAEFLGDGRYGIVLGECDDTEALAGALVRLCDEGERQTMSRAIEAEGVADRVSMRRHGREMLELYGEILARKGGRVQGDRSR